MKDFRKFCRPKFTKIPKLGDIIVKLKCGEIGVMTEEEYLKVLDFFKTDSFVGESESSPGSIIAINKKLGNIAIFNPEVYNDIKDLFDILEIVNEKYEIPPYVDLGLPSGILWAINNLNSPYYYSWGNLEGLDVINTGIFEETYEETPANELMEDIPLVTDAVNSVMGDYWRIPTKQNFEELILECTYEWTTQNNVDGYLFTSKNNSETLFIPINGIAGIDTTSSTFLSRFINKGIHISSGLGQINEVRGKSIVWNQLIKRLSTTRETDGIQITNNFPSMTFTGTATENGAKDVAYNLPFVLGHKYYVSFDNYPEKVSIAGHTISPPGIVTALNEMGTIGAIVTSGQTYDVTFKPMVIDLTLMFGANNEPDTVEAFESWLAQNVGLQEYYDYDEGSIINNNMEGLESIGFNLWDEQWQIGYWLFTTGIHSNSQNLICNKNYIKVLPNTTYYATRRVEVVQYDSLKNYISGGVIEGNQLFTTSSNCAYICFNLGISYGNTYNHDICINISDSSRNGTYEPYNKHVAYIDTTHIYGKKNGTGELVQVWPTGMPAIGDLKDVLKIEDGAVVAKRNLQEVDLGSFTWQYVTSGSMFAPYFFTRDANNINIKYVGSVGYTRYPLVCSKYVTRIRTSSDNVDKSIYPDEFEQKIIQIQIKDSSYSDAATFEAAMNGVMLYYELATPETYTDLVYMGSEYFADGTPVALPVNLQEDNWGVEWIIPENTSEIKTAPPTINFTYNLSELDKGNYWTSSYKDDDEAYIMHFDENNISIEEQYRYRGTLLRGVADLVLPEERQVLIGDIICYNSKINRKAMFSYEDWLNLSDSWDLIGIYGITTYEEETASNGDYVILSNGHTLIIKPGDYSKVSTNWEKVDIIFTPEVVDLDLTSNTLWATTNVGAYIPEEYGDYYLYGKGSTPYDSADDDYYNGTDNPLNSTIDTATQVWGLGYHTPTYDLLLELYNETDYTWITINGITGGKFTSKSNPNNYIFIPAAGAYGTGGNIKNNVGTHGYLYSSTPVSQIEGSDVYYLHFSESGAQLGTGLRTLGYSIRPVTD